MTSILSHVLAGLVGGGVIGAGLDYFAPDPKGVSSTGEAMSTGAEVVAQLAAGAYVSYSYFNYLGSKGIAPANDPSRGMSYVTSFMATQPKLFTKIQRLSSFGQRYLANVYMDTSKPVSTDISAGAQAYPEGAGALTLERPLNDPSMPPY